jgi:isopentenyl-diphosphate delta-isomerase
LRSGSSSNTTPEELFDVVDDADQVIGQQQRQVVHATGLKHRAVHILLFNSKGEVFLQRRSLQKDTFPGCWDSSCSGHVDAGENYEAAAHRELGEELGVTGIDSKSLEPLFKLKARSETGQEFIWVYRATHEGLFQLNAAEITEGKFFKPSEINELLKTNTSEFASAFVHLWPLCQGHARV